MTDETLTEEMILNAAENVLRDLGPAQADLSDIACAIGVSDEALSRHYDSITDLRKAVAKRWIHMDVPLLKEIVEKQTAAEERLYHWLQTLRILKRERARKDPELFTMYASLVTETEDVVKDHIETLLLQLTDIIEDGMLSRAFAGGNAQLAAEGVLLATSRFHHAAHAAEWEWPDADSRFESVWELVRCGLATRA